MSKIVENKVNLKYDISPQKSKMDFQSMQNFLKGKEEGKSVHFERKNNQLVNFSLKMPQSRKDQLFKRDDPLKQQRQNDMISKGEFATNVSADEFFNDSVPVIKSEPSLIKKEKVEQQKTKQTAKNAKKRLPSDMNFNDELDEQSEQNVSYKMRKVNNSELESSAFLTPFARNSPNVMNKSTGNMETSFLQKKSAKPNSSFLSIPGVKNEKLQSSFQSGRLSGSMVLNSNLNN